jgi:hypothetical protein
MSTSGALQTPQQGASTGATQILTALQNLVTAVNNAAQTLLNINGAANLSNISAPTVVKGSAGRICEVSVLTAGSAPGMVYDGASTTATTRPEFVIPNTVGIFVANWPMGIGILVVPGTGQVVSLTYS